MRNKTVDVIRGLLMLYIVGIVLGVFWLELIPRPFSSILLFEMPLIFLVSGYSFALFSSNTGFQLSFPGYFKYLVSRLIRVLVPYYGYATVCVIAIIAYTRGANYMAVISDWMNPFIFQKLDPFGLLTSHLWFVPPFIIVTLALPFISSVKLTIWSTVVPVCIEIVTLKSYSYGRLLTPFFYLYWTWIGYRLALDVKINYKILIAIILTGTISLLGLAYFPSITMDMQTNKFPPNLLFFAFSAVWVSFFLLLTSVVKASRLKFLEESKLLRPFINKGYSIYLWQGAGYLISIKICELLGLSKYFQWGMAVALAALIGIMFSPLEKIRWRFKKAESLPKPIERKTLVSVGSRSGAEERHKN